jgi:hypothetical protein
LLEQSRALARADGIIVSNHGGRLDRLSTKGRPFADDSCAGTP